MAFELDLSCSDCLGALRFVHDKRGGPRAAYAMAIGRVPEHGLFKDEFFTADLETNAVEDFIFGFYNAYNARFGRTY